MRRGGEEVNLPLNHFIKPGLVHFMAYPGTQKGEGPIILESLKKSLADDQRRSCSPKTRQEGSRLTLRSRRSYCGSLSPDWPFDKTRVPAVMNF